MKRARASRKNDNKKRGTESWFFGIKKGIVFPTIVAVLGIITTYCVNQTKEEKKESKPFYIPPIPVVLPYAAEYNRNNTVLSAKQQSNSNLYRIELEQQMSYMKYKASPETVGEHKATKNDEQINSYPIDGTTFEQISKFLSEESGNSNSTASANNSLVQLADKLSILSRRLDAGDKQLETGNTNSSIKEALDSIRSIALVLNKEKKSRHQNTNSTNSTTHNALENIRKNNAYTISVIERQHGIDVLLSYEAKRRRNELGHYMLRLNKDRAFEAVTVIKVPNHKKIAEYGDQDNASSSHP